MTRRSLRPTLVALAVVALLAVLVRPIGPCLMGHEEAPAAQHHEGHDSDTSRDEAPDGVERCPDFAGCTVLALASLSIDRRLDRLLPAPPASPSPAWRPAPILSIEPPPPRA